MHAAFSESPACGLLHLATRELETSLPAPFGFARDLARLYLTRLCQTPTEGEQGTLAPVPHPSETDLAFQVLQAPPMQGLEYLNSRPFRAGGPISMHSCGTRLHTMAGACRPT